MSSKLCRLVCLVVAFSACGVGLVSQSLGGPYDNTPNSLMGIDGMTLTAAGLFRDPGSFPYHNLPLDNNGSPIADGYNTFQFGGFTINPPITKGYGQYDAFRWQKASSGDCCISHNAGFNSNTPDNVTNATASPQVVGRVGEFDPAVPTADGVKVTKDYLPIIDRAFFGQLFDPAQYQIVVKFKPLLQKTTADSLGTNPYPTNPSYPPINAALENTAPLFAVGLDQLGGEVWDAQAQTYKRGDEQISYNIGSTATPINNWYATAPHDADGFATYSVPVTSPSFVQRGFYYGSGSAGTRTNDVAANGGIDATGADVTTGYGPNFQNFGGGPADPSNPGNKLNTPNGVPVMYLGAPSASTGVNFEIKSISLQRMTPGPVVVRMDANSGITFRFGSGFRYQGQGFNGQAPPVQPGIVVNGTTYDPTATDQISRFDGNGMTNLIFNERTPDSPTEVNRFVLRNAPEPLANDATATPGSGTKFVDCSQCTFNIRAKLTQPLTAGIAQTLRIVAKDRQGNDAAANQGADEWDYNLDLSQFNTSTMTTISLPLSMFTRNMTSTTLGPPVGFNNFGDGTLANFGLYEFGGLIPAGGGLLKLEMEYMEIRLPVQALVGDYNSNGIVDAADYTIWRDHLGQSFTLPNRDPLNTGVISNNDYTSWKNHFGQHSGSGSLGAGTVPEPSTLVLAFVALAGLARMRTKWS